jgi:hypothetical protein
MAPVAEFGAPPPAPPAAPAAPVVASAPPATSPAGSGETPDGGIAW